METLKTSLYKVALLAGPSLFWAGNHLLARYLRQDFHPYDLAFFRWTLALIVVGCLYGKSTLASLTVLWDSKWRVALLGLTGVSGYNTLFYYGLETTIVLNASFINSTIPLLIILMSWIFFKTIPRRIEWVCIALSVVGVMIILSRGDIQILRTLGFNEGDFFILSASLTWAVYSVWLSGLLKKVSPQVLLCAVIAVGWMFLVPYFGYRAVRTLDPHFTEPVQALKLSSLLFIIYVALFATIVAYRLWNKCVEVLGANLSGLSLNLLPLFTALGAVLFLGETFSSYHLWGGSTIMLSLAIVFYQKKANSKQN